MCEGSYPEIGDSIFFTGIAAVMLLQSYKRKFNYHPVRSCHGQSAINVY